MFSLDGVLQLGSNGRLPRLTDIDSATEPFRRAAAVWSVQYSPRSARTSFSSDQIDAFNQGLHRKRPKFIGKRSIPSSSDEDCENAASKIFDELNVGESSAASAESKLEFIAHRCHQQLIDVSSNLDPAPAVQIDALEKRGRKFVGKRGRKFVGKRNELSLPDDYNHNNNDDDEEEEDLPSNDNKVQDEDVDNVHQSQLASLTSMTTGDDDDGGEMKRGRMFVGKRGRMFVGKRGRMFVGKRGRKFVGKRSRMFVGKRPDSNDDGSTLASVPVESSTHVDARPTGDA